MGVKKEQEKSPIVIMLEAYCKEKRKRFDDDLTKQDWRCAHVALGHDENTLRGAAVMRRIMDRENAKS